MFCYCTSEPIMSVTLAVAIISLLPAAVGFRSHKDNIQWHFCGKEVKELWEKIHCGGWQRCCLNSKLCGYCTWPLFSRLSPKHTGRKACRPTLTVLMESGEEEEKKAEQGVRTWTDDTDFVNLCFLKRGAAAFPLCHFTDLKDSSKDLNWIVTNRSNILLPNSTWNSSVMSQFWSVLPGAF